MKEKYKDIINYAGLVITISSIFMLYLGIFSLTMTLLKFNISNFDAITWICFFAISSFWISIKLNSQYN